MNLEALLKESALVFHGKAVEVDRQLHDAPEPRTRVQFEVVELLLGQPLHGTTFDLSGGFDSNFDFVFVRGAPNFVQGEEYIVFIRAGAYVVTPITNWMHSHLEITQLQGQQYPVFSSGQCVSSVSASGLGRGALVTEPTFRVEAPHDSLGTISTERDASIPLASQLNGCLTLPDVIATLKGHITDPMVARPYSTAPARAFLTSAVASDAD